MGMTGMLTKCKQLTRPQKGKRSGQHKMNKVFAMKLHTQQMEQLEGDSGVRMTITSYEQSPFVERPSGSDVQLEFKNPVTNQVFLRAPLEQATQEMRRLSQMIDQQEEMSNENVSQSYEEDESLIYGQKNRVVKAILRKMLDHQNPSASFAPRCSNDISWSGEEMRALTEIFKDIVLGEKHGHARTSKSKSSRVWL